MNAKNQAFEIALSEVKKALNAKSESEMAFSKYFIHAKKNEAIKFHSLSETKKFFETECESEVIALLKLANCEKFTSEAFHAVLLTAIKLLLKA